MSMWMQKTSCLWKDYVWNLATYNCENWKYLAGIIDDSGIICDDVIESCAEEIKTIPINCNEKI